MNIIRHVEIELQIYHGEIVGRLRTETEESSLYSLGELINIIRLWKMGELLGSFGMDSQLAEDASFGLIQKVQP